MYDSLLCGKRTDRDSTTSTGMTLSIFRFDHGFEMHIHVHENVSVVGKWAAVSGVDVFQLRSLQGK
jgi:hypothetical protein